MAKPDRREYMKKMAETQRILKSLGQREAEPPAERAYYPWQGYDWSGHDQILLMTPNDMDVINNTDNSVNKSDIKQRMKKHVDSGGDMR